MVTVFGEKTFAVADDFAECLLTGFGFGVSKFGPFHVITMSIVIRKYQKNKLQSQNILSDLMKNIDVNKRSYSCLGKTHT